MTDDSRISDAARVRDACIEAALAGYEDAAISGLCGEGALEVAISAMRRVDLSGVLAPDDQTQDDLISTNTSANERKERE